MRFSKSVGLRNNDNCIIPEIFIPLMMLQSFRTIFRLPDLSHHMPVFRLSEKKIKTNIGQFRSPQYSPELISGKKDCLNRTVCNLRYLNPPGIPIRKEYLYCLRMCHKIVFCLLYKSIKIYNCDNSQSIEYGTVPSNIYINSVQPNDHFPGTDVQSTSK